MREIDKFYLYKDEPVKGCLLFIRDFILKYDNNITEAWKFNMPFFCYKGKMFCYLWVYKKTGLPYLGMVEGKRLHHPLLISENRSRMKVIVLNPEEDIPVEDLGTILTMALDIYKSPSNTL